MVVAIEVALENDGTAIANRHPVHSLHRKVDVGGEAEVHVFATGRNLNIAGAGRLQENLVNLVIVEGLVAVDEVTELLKLLQTNDIQWVVFRNSQHKMYGFNSSAIECIGDADGVTSGHMQVATRNAVAVAVHLFPSHGVAATERVVAVGQVSGTYRVR